MKLGPVTKINKRNKTTPKKFGNDKCDIIVIFPIYGQFGAMQKPDSGCIVCKTYFVINSKTFYLTKTQNRTKKSLTQFSHYCFE